MTQPGVFITLEGPDGSGKSTQAALLAELLREITGREVIATFEPGDTPLGQQLRQAVQHGEAMGPHAEALLYAADRAHHVATLVRPALARGAIVVCDRYLDSSVAYQAAGRSLPAAEIEALSLWATGGLLPDLTILVDVDDATARTRQSGELDRIEAEGPEFRQLVRQQYLDRAAADPTRWAVVDGAGEIADVAAAVAGEVTARLPVELGLGG